MDAYTPRLAVVRAGAVARARTPQRALPPEPFSQTLLSTWMHFTSSLRIVFVLITSPSKMATGFDFEATCRRLRSNDPSLVSLQYVQIVPIFDIRLESRNTLDLDMLREAIQPNSHVRKLT
jgi:hypothetical protein